jgi:hypothetical protein
MRAARVLIATIVFAACGGSSPGTPAGAAGTTGDAGTGGAAGTTGAAGKPPPAVASCGEYCADLKVACKGANAQYYDDANCMKVCARLAPGTLADTTGNTVGCRINAALVAAFETTPIKASCWMAGPLGIGGCGAECDTFCAVATSYCTAAEGYTGVPPFVSLEDCHAQCGAWRRQLDFSMVGAYGPAYSPGSNPDTLECRASHLLVNAFKGTDAQQMHCPHAANKSEICGPGNPVTDGGVTDGGVTDGAGGDAD